jgi:hypothetical protein
MNTLMTAYLKTARALREITDCSVTEIRDALPLLCPDLMGTTGEDDFTVHLGGSEWRFIKDTDNRIAQILAEELENDAYILGCFNAGFIADHSDLSYEIIAALQEGDKHEALGQHLIDNGFVEAMAEGYISADGAGHHFAHYDGNEHELEIPETHATGSYQYLVFNCG